MVGLALISRRKKVCIYYQLYTFYNIFFFFQSMAWTTLTRSRLAASRRQRPAPRLSIGPVQDPPVPLQVCLGPVCNSYRQCM